MVQSEAVDVVVRSQKVRVRIASLQAVGNSVAGDASVARANRVLPVIHSRKE